MQKEQDGPRLVALIPSLRGSEIGLKELVSEFSKASVKAYVVPTGISLQNLVVEHRIPHIKIGDNPGFGQSIRLSEQQVEWDVLIIANDDIKFDGHVLGHYLQAQDSGQMKSSLLYLDPGDPKEIPSPSSVFRQVSLWRNPFRNSVTKRAASAHSHFRPFSFVAIGRDLWRDLDGMDQELIYTFEDADFGRRAANAGATIQFPNLPGISHEKYSTSGRHIGKVLPVAAWSACKYSGKWHSSATTARMICIAALFLRIPAIPFSSLPWRSHLAGTLLAIRALMTGRQPRLPAFAQN